MSVKWQADMPDALPEMMRYVQCMAGDLQVLLEDAGYLRPDGELDLPRAAKDLGVSVRTMNRWLKGDTKPKEGVLRYLRRRTATGTIEVDEVPVLGVVNAGPLQLRYEAPRGYVEVAPRGEHDEREIIALEVEGDSMTPLINPGDIIVVRLQQDADSGDIVVALVGDMSTVKRLRGRGKGRYLEAFKEGFPPIRPTGPWNIFGKVLEVRRILEKR